MKCRASHLLVVSGLGWVACGGGGDQRAVDGGGSDTVDATQPTFDGQAPTADAPVGPSCTTPDVEITHDGTTPGSSFDYVLLDPSTAPNAVCNDGTPGAYLIRPGGGGGAHRWVILLQGGGDCYDDTSCEKNASATGQFGSGLTTSNWFKNNPSARPGGAGILDPNPATNPDFYDANLVLGLYCTSDDWSGTKTGSGTFSKSDSSTWNFQGRAVATGIVADLVKNHGLASATEIMLTGSSAGGVGVIALTNDFATSLHTIAPAARFVSYPDAAYANHHDNYAPSNGPPDYIDTTSTPFDIYKRELGLPLWQAHGDSVCAAHATTLAEQIACYDVQTVAGSNLTITLPLLVSVSQEDMAQIDDSGSDGKDGIPLPPTTAPELGYINYFANTLHDSFVHVNTNVSVFAPDARDPYVHVEENDVAATFTRVYPFPTASASLQSAIGAWYRSPCTPVRHIAAVGTGSNG